MPGIITLVTTLIITGLTVNCGIEALECSKVPQNLAFKCKNGQCTYINFRCDSIKHCDDNSDEMNCSTVKCTAKEFQCASGQCLPAYLKCNGIHDCIDHSDELDCSNEVCSTNEFHCPPGYCLLSHSNCNYRCPYHSEDADVTISNSATCDEEIVNTCPKEFCVQPGPFCVTGDACTSDVSSKVASCSSGHSCGYNCDSNGNCKSINNKCQFIYDCKQDSGPQYFALQRLTGYSYILAPTWTINSANVQVGNPISFQDNSYMAIGVIVGAVIVVVLFTVAVNTFLCKKRGDNV